MIVAAGCAARGLEIDVGDCSAPGHADPLGQLGSRERPPPFLTKLLQILETSEYSDVVRWAVPGEQRSLDASYDALGDTPGGYDPLTAFVVVDPNAFAKTILPRFFKHNKLSSFIQQLYTYGFRRASPAPAALSVSPSAERGCALDKGSAIAFMHDSFRPGRTDLLNQIKRGSTPRVASSSAFGPRAPAFDRAPLPAYLTSSDSSDTALSELRLEMSALESMLNQVERTHRERYAIDGQWLEYLIHAVQHRLRNRASGPSAAHSAPAPDVAAASSMAAPAAAGPSAHPQSPSISITSDPAATAAALAPAASPAGSTASTAPASASPAVSAPAPAPAPAAATSADVGVKTRRSAAGRCPASRRDWGSPAPAPAADVTSAVAESAAVDTGRVYAVEAAEAADVLATEARGFPLEDRHFSNRTDSEASRSPRDSVEL